MIAKVLKYRLKEKKHQNKLIVCVMQCECKMFQHLFLNIFVYFTVQG